MEFNEKLQELRKRKGITQEELASALFVSRTAVSKWESGRGYPNLESLKAISNFFSVTLDNLLSSDEIFTIAETQRKQTQNNVRDMIFGMLDVSMILLLFLPLFAGRNEDVVRAVTLVSLDGVESYLKIIYYVLIVTTTFMGAAILLLQNCKVLFWLQIKRQASVLLSTLAVLIFIITLHPYAALYAFFLLFIKASMLIKLQ